MLMVEVPEVPAPMCAGDEAEISKSARTVMVMLVVRMILLLFDVMMTV